MPNSIITNHSIYTLWSHKEDDLLELSDGYGRGRRARKSGPQNDLSDNFCQTKERPRKNVFVVFESNVQRTTMLFTQ